MRLLRSIYPNLAINLGFCLVAYASYDLFVEENVKRNVSKRLQNAFLGRTDFMASAKPQIVMELPPKSVIDLDSYECLSDGVAMEALKQLSTNHVLYSSLLGPNKIKTYKVYRNQSGDEIVALVEFGSTINGWPNVVHGGVSALLLDNNFGWLLFTCIKKVAVTANLNVNYRNPVYANSASIVRVKVDKIEGKKLTMSGSIINAKTGQVQVEATSLFIIINDLQTITNHKDKSSDTKVDLKKIVDIDRK